MACDHQPHQTPVRYWKCNHRYSGFVVLAFVLQMSVARISKGQDPVVNEQPSAANALEELAVKSYDVSKALARIAKETGKSSNEAEQWLQSKLKRKLDELSVEPEEDGDRVTKTGNVGGVKVDWKGNGVRISKGTATVVAHADLHDPLYEWLTTLQEFGLRQVVIRTTIIRSDPETVTSSLPVQWSHVETSSPLAMAKPTQEQVRAPSSINLLSTVRAETVGSPERENSPVVPSSYLAYRESPQGPSWERPSDVVGKNWTEAYSIVERSNPVLFTILSPEQTETLKEALHNNEKIESVMSPSVVVFDGQRGTVNSSSERPFVVGIEPVVSQNEVNKTIQFQPKVKVYSEGTSLMLRPDLDGKRIRLSYELNISEIREVETFAMPRFDGHGEFVVQIPEVATTVFKTSQTLPENFSLAVSTYEKGKDGEKTAMLVLCQCNVVDIHQKLRKASSTHRKDTSSVRR